MPKGVRGFERIHTLYDLKREAAKEVARDFREFRQGEESFRETLARIRQRVEGFTEKYKDTLLEILEFDKIGELLSSLSDRLVDEHGVNPTDPLITRARGIAEKMLPDEPEEVPSEGKVAGRRMRSLRHLLGEQEANKLLSDRTRDDLMRVRTQAIADLAKENGIP